MRGLFGRRLCQWPSSSIEHTSRIEGAIPVLHYTALILDRKQAWAKMPDADTLCHLWRIFACSILWCLSRSHRVIWSTVSAGCLFLSRHRKHFLGSERRAGAEGMSEMTFCLTPLTIYVSFQRYHKIHAFVHEGWRDLPLIDPGLKWPKSTEDKDMWLPVYKERCQIPELSTWPNHKC